MTSPVAKVVDLSHYNIIPLSLKPAYEAGIRGVIHKGTEGLGRLDPKCGGRYFLAKDAGLLWGLYHFIRPGDPVQQAQNFLSMTARVRDAKTLLVCDYEVPEVPLSNVLAFLDFVYQVTGRVRLPVLYSGNTLKEAQGDITPLTKFPLWLAQYSPTPVLPKGFTKYWMWQFTDSGAIPGITGAVDCNAYAGSDDALIADWTTGTVPDITTPVSLVESTIGVSLAVPPGVSVMLYINGESVYTSKT